MNCNKYVKFLVWMGELFAVWDAAMSRISHLCRHFLTCVSTSTGRQNLWWRAGPRQQLRTGSTKVRKLVGRDRNGLISEGKKLEFTFT